MTPKLIAAHLDLKGANFRPGYDHEFLENLRALDVNALVVEYEDAFPFEGLELANDKRVVWSRQRLGEFQGKAASMGIEIIPLQQTLGHLEYVFRWKKYASYALPGHPSTLDLWNPGAVHLIDEMLVQVLRAHGNSRFVHVGMDEAHSLVAAAKHKKIPVLSLFFERLEKICRICEQHRKTPIIFSDMLEEHFSEEALKILRSFKERIILQPWDYRSDGSPSYHCRMGGIRVARHWINQGLPEVLPTAMENVRVLEDLPPPVFRLVRPHLRNNKIAPLCQVAIWLKLGFRVLGATAVRISSDGQYLIPYHKRLANIRAWTKWLRYKNFIGLMATSWARGNSFCRPNALIEVTWSLLKEFAQECGRTPAPFFGDCDRQAHALIAQSQSFLEGKVSRQAFLEKAEALAPKIKRHSFEWKLFCLLLQAFLLKNQGDLVQREVDDYLFSKQLPPQLWERRMADQKRYLVANRKLKAQFQKLLMTRYHGTAVKEWISGVFDTPRKRLEAMRSHCLSKTGEARKIYG
jgi:hypothetical protein